MSIRIAHYESAHPNKKRNINGYIAITSAIIISLLLMVIVFALSFSSFFGRYNIFDSQTKEISQALAEACAEKALLNLSQNSSYPGNETITVKSPDTCDILTIETSGSQKTIKTRATFQKTATNIKIIASTTPNLSIVSWEEVPNF
jgi:hypothetical protein